MSFIRIIKKIIGFSIVTVTALIAFAAHGNEFSAPAIPKTQLSGQLVGAPGYLLAISKPVLRNNEQAAAGRTVSRVLNELRNAEAHGLDSGDYEVAALSEIERSLFDREMSFADVLFATEFAKRAMLGFVIDLKYGSDKVRDQEIEEVSARLDAALSSEMLDEFVSELIPQHRDYRALQDLLATLLQRREDGGWPAISAGPTIELGVKNKRVAILRQRLGVTSATDDGVFDETLRDAILAYQTLHGLDADGKAGKRTIAHLDRSVESRIAQTKINLARWRSTSLPTAGNFVHVNVPSYNLRYARHAKDDLSMRVIVGDENTPTPIFNDAIEYLVFSPYWDVPRSITVNELLPQARQDPDYLRRGNYEIVGESGVVSVDSLELTNATAENFPYRIRQKPGKNNSLGLVKFIFPNSYSVYLHDTPADSLFARSDRALSHGCVRVEYPAELAAAMLADNPEWNGERVSTAMHGYRPDYVNLNTPIPVHITYFTVTTTENGEAGFFDDIYGYDTASRRMFASSRLAPFPVNPDLQMASTTVSR